MAVTMKLEIPAQEIDLVQRVFRLIDDGFLPERCVAFIPATSTYEVTVEGGRVAHLLELLEAGTDSTVAETYTERLYRLGQQQQLPLDEMDEWHLDAPFEGLH